MTHPATTQSKLQQLSSGSPRILFLGYTQTETRLIDALISKGCEVWHTADKMQTTTGFHSVISFGYRQILPKEVIESSGAPVLNLHIAYLPYNRGYHPNFWAFYDGTPHGVTIHLIDQGIDTGPILFQNRVTFDQGEITFEQTHQRLILEIENLFIQNIDAIIASKLAPKPQHEKGSHHWKADLPKDFAGWHSNIEEEIARLTRSASPA